MDVPTKDYPDILKLLLDALIKKNDLKKYALFDDNITGSILLKIQFTKPKIDPSGEEYSQIVGSAVRKTDSKEW